MEVVPLDTGEDVARLAADIVESTRLTTLTERHVATTHASSSPSMTSHDTC